MSDPVEPDPTTPGPASSDPDPAAPAAPPAGPSRFLILNAIFPGLGHLVAGRAGWALILAAPMLALLVAGMVVALTSNSTTLAARLFDPEILTGLLALQVAILLWRLVALGATRIVRPIRLRRATVAAGVVALLLVVGPQLYALNLTAEARDAATQVFQPVGEGGAWVPTETAPPVASDDPDFGEDASPSPSASPSESPSETPGVPRINVLLIGMDSGIGRNTALTDTMIVASLDPVGRTISMASVPRDMVDVPLPDGRIFKGKINSLVSYVRWHPGKFPGAKDGQSVLAAALGQLLGLRIDMWAQVNLGGFVYLVDSLGGINITVTDGFCDPRYKEYGINGFSISPGRYHMNGDQALAYARVRKAAGESDFTRAGRQQEVLAAIRDRLVHGAFLDNPGSFLRSLGQTVSTNITPSVLADSIDIAAGIPRTDVFRIVIQHPLVRGTSDERGSIQVPDLDAIHAMAAKLFTPTGIRPTGFDTMPAAGSGPTKNATSSSTCSISPKPTPTPKPTPKPTPTATASPGDTPTPTPEPTPTPTPAPSAAAESPSPS